MSSLNKGGRPKSADPRKFKLTASLSGDEFARATASISAAGLSRSEALRLLVLGAEFPEFQRMGLDPNASAAYANLAPLQSNLNQIAHWFNRVQPLEIDRETTVKIARNIEITYTAVKALRREILGAKS